MTTHLDSKISILEDYGTRYEELLLSNRKLRSTHQSSNSSTSTSGTATATNTESQYLNVQTGSKASASESAISLLSNHAAMNGMLQCAIRAAKQSPDVSGDTVESIQCLLEETMHCNDYGLDAAGVASDNVNANVSPNNHKHPESKCSMNASPSCLGEHLTNMALEHSRQFQIKMQSAGYQFEITKRGQEEHLDDIDSDAEVDAFFQDCPEYNHESFTFFDVPDEYDDGDEMPKKRKPATAVAASAAASATPSEAHSNQPQMQIQTQNQPSLTNTNANANANANAQKKLHYNPYTRQNQVNGYEQTTNIRVPPQNNNNNSNNKASWDAYNTRNEDQTMIVAPQNDNPFRTAQEVRNNSSLQENVNDYQQDNRQNGNGGNVYGGNNPEGSGNGFNPNRPNLSAGLKRKFQLPKPRPSTDHNRGNSNANTNITSNSTSNSNSNSNSNGNRASNNRTHGSSNSDTQNNNNNKPPSSEEEDDLPEELKGLDRELIAKIENEIVDAGESITFKDIAGLHECKQTVMELVCWPMKRPDLFTGLRRGPNGLLLFGPPGTGKTLIGKAIAHESGATFFSISSSSLTSKWIGEGEKLVRTLFAVAAYREPAVVFIDEIDSLLTQRKADENEASRRMKTEFLVQLDGTGTSGQGRVLAIGATNRPSELDDAARRRFVKRLYIPLPEAEDREVLLRTLLKKNNHNLSDKEITKLSNEGTKGFSGADLKALCTDASLGPIRQLGIRALEIDANDVPPISYKHFRQALKGMNPSVAQADLDAYIDFNRTYGSKSITAEEYDNLSDEDESDGSETQ